MHSIKIYSLMIILSCLLVPMTVSAKNIPFHSTIIADANQQQPTISAEQSKFDEETGRYTLKKNVRISFAGRTITTNTAEISSKTMQLWTKGDTKLLEGELCFSGAAMYAELAGDSAYFFGSRCKLERPGLVIQADSMNYNWQTHIVSFDGHVFCAQNGHDTAAAHLEFDLEKNTIIK